MPPHIKDLTGMTFRNVTFLKKRADSRDHLRLYDIRCNLCGAEVVGKGPTVLYKTRNLGTDWCPRCKDKRITSKLNESGRQRRALIRARWTGGETLQSIATEFGITRERVRQLVMSGLSSADVVAMLAHLPDATVRAALEKIGPTTVKKIVFIGIELQRQGRASSDQKVHGVEDAA